MSSTLALVVNDGAVVEQPAPSSTPRPLQLSRADMEELAVALLDLGGAVETALRTVLSMQRSLERIRRCDELSPEGSLLLQEMNRQIQALTEGQAGVDERLRIASRQIAFVRCAER